MSTRHRLSCASGSGSRDPRFGLAPVPMAPVLASGWFGCQKTTGFKNSRKGATRESNRGPKGCPGDASVAGMTTGGAGRRTATRGPPTIEAAGGFETTSKSLGAATGRSGPTRVEAPAVAKGESARLPEARPARASRRSAQVGPRPVLSPDPGIDRRARRKFPASGCRRGITVETIGLGSNLAVHATTRSTRGLPRSSPGALAEARIEGGARRRWRATNAVCLPGARAVGLAALEFAAAIPGTAGGGVRMNAGSRARDWRAVMINAVIVERRRFAHRRRGQDRTLPAVLASARARWSRRCATPHTGAARRDSGSAVGVNVRMTDYSGVNAEVIEELADVISAAVIRLNAPCVSLPIRIATDGASDLEVTAPILKRCPKVIEVPPSIARPPELMPYIAQCRCVITGSYHAGVFALAMGIPVIGLAASPYYMQKFLGLADQFSGGCQTIDLNAADWKQSLAGAIGSSYGRAEELRPALIRCAEEQITACTEAYARLPSLLSQVAAT